MDASTRAADRRFCRETLPAVSRTFAINIRLLAGPLGDAVRTGYLLCRAADTLEDRWPGTPEEIRGRFDRLLAAVAGDAAAGEALAAEARALGSVRPDHALLAGLPRVLRAHAALEPEPRAIVADGVRVLAAGMRRYAARAAERGPGTPYLDGTAELHDYCYVVAGCVGEMLTRLWHASAPRRDRARDAGRLALAPVVGEALQLTNILLDWPADVRAGRCHVPAEWLAEHDLRPADLVGADRPGVRAIAARLEALARAALADVPRYVALLPAGAVRYRLFCLWPALWARASLDHAARDPQFPWGPRRPKLPRARLWGEIAGSLLDPARPRTLALPATPRS